LGVYQEAFHHFVWATRKREAFVTSEMERFLYCYIRQRCSDLRVTIYALNGMSDHVHLVVSLPAVLSPAKFMNEIKGASAHFINHLPEVPSIMDCLYWQEGYGWLTFDLERLSRAVKYVDHQKEHHAVGSLSRKMEYTTDWEAHSESREAGVLGVRAD